MADTPVTSNPSAPGWSRWIERLRRATAGRFTILRELGRGGFAAVFLAQQQQPSRRVAIKLLLPAHLESAWALDHFRGESQKIAEWRHQSVVTIYEVHEVDDLFFFVMSYVEGGSLTDLIGQMGPLPVPIVRSVLAQVGGALQYAHRQGVTHRDIKPQNVLIDVDGGAVVTDFGISKHADGTSHTVSGMIFGTAPYMAPEQCETGATEYPVRPVRARHSGLRNDDRLSAVQGTRHCRAAGALGETSAPAAHAAARLSARSRSVSGAHAFQAPGRPLPEHRGGDASG